MPLSGSADRTLAVLCSQQSLEPNRNAVLSPQLLNVVSRVQATSTLILALEQARKLIDGPVLTAPVTRRPTIPDMLVLDKMDAGTNQTTADGRKKEPFSPRDLADRQTTLEQVHDRRHGHYLERKQ